MREAQHSGKRPIASLPFDGLTPGAPPTGKPEITWISPGELLVDEAYQRDLSPASLKLIRRIVEGWDWRRFKPPVVAWSDGGLEVIDGQHSAIAAATHPSIDAIPVVVVEAAEQVDRAHAFIGHNRDRIAITAAQMHVAAAAAGDADALAVNRICAAAGLELMRLPPAAAVYRPGTTIAVAAVRAVVDAETEINATYILKTLADAGFAPVTSAHIKAVHHLATSEDFDGLDREALAATVQSMPIKATEKEAKEHAAMHSVPVWRGLAAIWFKATKKRPRRVEPPAPPPEPAPPALAARGLPTDEIKRDTRLGRGRWKPGHYVRRCHTCDERFRGDGQATECADCAYAMETVSP